MEFPLEANGGYVIWGSYGRLIGEALLVVTMDRRKNAVNGSQKGIEKT